MHKVNKLANEYKVIWFIEGLKLLNDNDWDIMKHCMSVYKQCFVAIWFSVNTVDGG